MNRSEHEQLFAVSALDGRYRPKVEGLVPYVSEAGLIAYRLRVEAEWLLHLAETPGVKDDYTLHTRAREVLQHLSKGAPDAAFSRIKELERTTNHDVKAVEYYLREALTATDVDSRALAFIHFACTSEDINNLAYALLLHEAREKVVLPAMDRILKQLNVMALRYRDLPMLSRTHGQTASPTTLGKEMAVFAHRLGKQRRRLATVELEGKMSGAVGNYNAHLAAYPELDWIAISRDFIERRLGLKQNLLTTQIENHDSMVEYTSCLQHFNTIAIGLCRDMWSYISLDYFKQETKAGEVGSSTMPHKVNPIDFENAEGNFGVANSLAAHYADKLLISRWQRDLSDSTVQRTLGTFLGHSLLACQSLERGLSKVSANPSVIADDLASAPEVLGEAIQTCMRRYGIVDAYERLKAATRGHRVRQEDLQELIRGCREIPEGERQRLLALSPEAYVGCAAELVNRHSKEGQHATH